MYIRLTAIIIKDSSILLIQKKKDDGSFRYTLPGGHWDFPESFKSGVAREVLEECGLRLEKSKLHKSHIDIKANRIEFMYICSVHPEDLEKEPFPSVLDKESSENSFAPKFIDIFELNDLNYKYLSTKKVITKLADTML